MKKKTARRPSHRLAKSTLGSALTSTASFAAGVVRETGELVRNVASSVTKSTDAGPSPGATDLLVHQHRLVEKLFERLESSKKGFDDTLRQLADGLTAHISIEEQLFYPAVRKANPDLILEGLEEHAMGRFALQRLLGTTAADKALKARLKALKELMTNHHHEEERDLFPKVRRLMSDAVLEKLGAQMLALFNRNLERGYERSLRPSMTLCGNRCTQKRSAQKRNAQKRNAQKRGAQKRGAYDASDHSWRSSRASIPGVCRSRPSAPSASLVARALHTFG